MCGTVEKGTESSGAVIRSPPAAGGGGSCPGPSPYPSPSPSPSPAARPLPQPPPRVTASQRGPRLLCSYQQPAVGQLPLPLLRVHGVWRDAGAAKEIKPGRKKRAGLHGHSGRARRAGLRGHSGRARLAGLRGHSRRARRSPVTRAGLHGPRGHRHHLRSPLKHTAAGKAERGPGAGACARPARPGCRAQGPAARHLLLLGLGARGVPHCFSKFKKQRRPP